MAEWAGKRPLMFRRPRERRFRWSRLRFQWGCWCSRISADGEMLESWWEWENDIG